jgi:hypothetical protein
MTIRVTTVSRQVVRVLLVSGALACGSLAAAQLYPAEGYPVGAGVDGVAIGDLDSNGTLDAVAWASTSNSSTPLAYRMLGTGGGLGAPVPVPVGGGCRRLALGDFDDDGTLDAAVVLAFPARVAVLYGTPAGFSVPLFLASTDTPMELALGDLDNDSRADIVVRGIGETFSVFLSLGAGGFTGAIDYATSGTGSALGLVDLNGDGDLDLAYTVLSDPGSPDAIPGGLFGSPPPGMTIGSMLLTALAGALPSGPSAGSSGAVSPPGPLTYGIVVRLGDGLGAFGKERVKALPGFSRSIASSDWNGDGNNDVAAFIGTNQIVVLHGTGSGGFTTGATLSTGGTESGRVHAADVNGDSKPDIVAKNTGTFIPNNFAMVTFLGNGAGGFTTSSTVDLGHSTAFLALGDMTADSLPDAVLASGSGPGLVSILRGTGLGTFTVPTDVPTIGSPLACVASDLDADGVIDLVAANPVVNAVSIARGLASGTFAPATSLAVAGGPIDVIATDMNGDGRRDLVTANATGASVAVLLGLAGGGYAPPAVSGVSPSPQCLAIADLDGNTFPDVVVGHFTGGSVSVLLGSAAGLGPVTAFAGAGTSIRGIATADFNADGRPDVAVPNGTSVRVLLGNGAGGLGVATPYPAGIPGVCLVAADMNVDGKVDVVMSGGFHLSVLLGDGTGALLAPSLTPNVFSGESLAAGDTNGDGRPDIAVGTFAGGNVVQFFLNMPLGGFAPPRYFATGMRPLDVLIVDVTGDGKRDIVTAIGPSISGMYTGLRISRQL